MLQVPNESPGLATLNAEKERADMLDRPLLTHGCLETSSKLRAVIQDDRTRDRQRDIFFAAALLEFFSSHLSCT